MRELLEEKAIKMEVEADKEEEQERKETRKREIQSASYDFIKKNKKEVAVVKDK